MIHLPMIRNWLLEDFNGDPSCQVDNGSMNKKSVVVNMNQVCFYETVVFFFNWTSTAINDGISTWRCLSDWSMSNDIYEYHHIPIYVLSLIWFFTLEWSQWFQHWSKSHPRNLLVSTYYPEGWIYIYIYTAHLCQLLRIGWQSLIPMLQKKAKQLGPTNLVVPS